MATRSERDRQKALQEKHQMILSQLLKDEDNKYCVDCDAKGPRWASWNLGIFLCIRCAGIHRNLGVHISKVKSVNLDTWTPEQISMIQEMGNSRARAVYEANIPDNYRRPQTDSALEAFIRCKYETKKYIAHEWVPPQPKKQFSAEVTMQPGQKKPGKKTSKQENDPIFEEMPKKKKEKSRPKTDTSVKLNAPPGTTNSSTTVKTERPQTKLASSTKPVESKPVAIDLLGLDEPPPVSDSNDLFGDFMSNTTLPNSTSQPQQLGTATAAANNFNSLSPQQNQVLMSNQENLDNPLAIHQQNGDINNHTTSNGITNSASGSAGETNDLTLLGEGSGGGSEQKKSKESILALYGSGGSSMPQQQQQQMYQVPGGMYMSNNTAAQMPGGIPPQMMNQQQQMYQGMMQQQPQMQQQQQQQPQMQQQQPQMQQQLQQQQLQQQQANGGVMGIQPGLMQHNTNMMPPQQGVPMWNTNMAIPVNNMGAVGMGGMNPGMMNNMGGGMMGTAQPMYNTQNMYNMQSQQMTQQLQNQMSAMSMGGGASAAGPAGAYQQPGTVAAGGGAGMGASMGSGWGLPQTHGNTLSNNLWQ